MPQSGRFASSKRETRNPCVHAADQRRRVESYLKIFDNSPVSPPSDLGGASRRRRIPRKWTFYIDNHPQKPTSMNSDLHTMASDEHMTSPSSGMSFPMENDWEYRHGRVDPGRDENIRLLEPVHIEGSKTRESATIPSLSNDNSEPSSAALPPTSSQSKFAYISNFRTCHIRMNCPNP